MVISEVLSIPIVVQAALYGCSAAVVLARVVPPLGYVLQYGKALSSEEEENDNGHDKVYGIWSNFRLWLAPLTTTLPKSWFWHFYVSGLVTAGLALFFMHGNQSDNTRLVLILLGLQTTRRLVECVVLEKQSSAARIRVGHYIVGHAFYVLAVAAFAFDHDENDEYYKFWDARQRPSGLALVPVLVMFVVAFVSQYLTHVQLSRLVKYSPPPPTWPFKYLICPHYTAEVIIYFALAWLVAFSASSVAVVVWVAVNLGASAEQSKKFYINKFGPQSVKSKFMVLPPVW
ncbi:hypothetical protein V1514DRAFT_24046 [Lipomyces japonicus]|uniref:uncharacterized protein n=1 Tax=Lipomyces japonicus TaxID=56871 RepID=UPI0034CECA25